MGEEKMNDIIKEIKKVWDYRTSKEFIEERDEEEQKIIEKIKKKGFEWFLNQYKENIIGMVKSNDTFFDLVDDMIEGIEK